MNANNEAAAEFFFTDEDILVLTIRAESDYEGPIASVRWNIPRLAEAGFLTYDVLVPGEQGTVRITITEAGREALTTLEN